MLTAMPRPLVTTLRILLVSAVNPDDPPLDVDEEFAGILDRLGGHRHVRIQQRTALTMARLQSALLEVRPHVLHFASHGVPGYLLLRPPDIHSSGKISSSALTRLFGAIGRDLRLVVFNACGSLDIARAVVSAPRSPVDWAIGMATRIYDDDAIEFSAALYEVLAAGEAIGAAFEAALAMLETRPASAKDTAPVEIPRLLPEDPTTADATPLVAPPVDDGREGETAPAAPPDPGLHLEQHRRHLEACIHSLRQEIARESIAPDRSEARLESLQAELTAAQTALRDGPRFKPGDVVDGRYHISAQIGLGGFATVFRAHDAQESVDVALKILHPNLNQRAEIRERFTAAANCAIGLHTLGAARILAPAACYLGHHYIVMELLAGSFRDVWPRLTPHERLSVVVQTGHTLHAAHIRGIVHRDVRPDNILVDARNQARLTDFDIAHFPGSNNHTQAVPMGVYLYTAPEQMNSGRDATVKSDIYSLALVTIFALTGRDPDLAQFQHDRYRVIEALDCPPLLRVILARAVTVDPRDRYYETAEHFADHVAECIQSQPLASPGRSLPALLALECAPEDVFARLVRLAETRNKWRCRRGARMQRAVDFFSYVSTMNDQVVIMEIDRLYSATPPDMPSADPAIETWEDVFIALCSLPPGHLEAFQMDFDYWRDLPGRVSPAELARACIDLCKNPSREIHLLDRVRAAVRPIRGRMKTPDPGPAIVKVGWIHERLHVLLDRIDWVLRSTPAVAAAALSVRDYDALRAALEDLQQQPEFPLALVPLIGRASRLAVEAELALVGAALEPRRDPGERYTLYAALCRMDEPAWLSLRAKYVLPCMLTHDASRATAVRQLLDRLAPWCLGVLRSEIGDTATPDPQCPSTGEADDDSLEEELALMPSDLFEELLLRLNLHERPWPRYSSQSTITTYLLPLRPGVEYRRIHDDFRNEWTDAFSGPPMPYEPGPLAALDIDDLGRVWTALGLPAWFRLPADVEPVVTVVCLWEFLRWLRLPWWSTVIAESGGDIDRLVERISHARSRRRSAAPA